MEPNYCIAVRSNSGAYAGLIPKNLTQIPNEAIGFNTYKEALEWITFTFYTYCIFDVKAGAIAKEEVRKEGQHDEDSGF